MIKKRLFLLFIIFTVFSGFFQPAFCESTTPEPYNDEEFPKSLRELRRFEIITLGAMPFVTLDVTIAYSGIRWAKNGFSNEYSPNPFAVSSYDPQEQKKIVLTSLGISVGIGLSDFIVRFIKEVNAEKKLKNNTKTIVVNPIDSDPDAIKLTNPYDEVETVEETVEETSEGFVEESVTVEKDFVQAEEE